MATGAGAAGAWMVLGGPQSFCTRCNRFGHVWTECTGQPKEEREFFTWVQGRSSREAAHASSERRRTPTPPRPSRARVSLEGEVDEVLAALGQLALGSARQGAGAQSFGGVPVARPRKAKAAKGPGRPAGETPPPGVRRCLGHGQTGERCKRWSSDSYPQSATILETGYCTQHLGQRV